MIAGLESIQESKTIGAGSAFFGIMRASELVPYDSAIFISTDSVPADTDSAQYAAITLLKKRIRVSPSSNHNLGQLSIYNEFPVVFDLVRTSSERQ